MHKNSIIIVLLFSFPLVTFGQPGWSWPENSTLIITYDSASIEPLSDGQFIKYKKTRISGKDTLGFLTLKLQEIDTNIFRFETDQGEMTFYIINNHNLVSDDPKDNYKMKSYIIYGIPRKSGSYYYILSNRKREKLYDRWFYKISIVN